MRTLFKRSLLAGAVALSVAACGGGSSSGGGTADPGETITGTASAPGGSVAQFEQKNAIEVALEFFVNPVAAAITGLEPVTGATVELIRVDDEGAQIGDVLATTSTSITGDYTLTLPAGVNLAGNLIVRITGVGGTVMRAQVVETEVDISPVSEFVLSKFIDDGVDLDNLTTASVIKLSGQVEDFDLTAGADLTTMLAALEEEVGSFVDNQIDIISAPAGNASSIAGSYRNAGFDFGLHDDDQQYGGGTFSLDLWNVDLTLADGGNGIVKFTINSEESAWSNLSYSDNGDDPDTVSLNYEAEIETETETFDAQINQNGVLSIDGEFEEEIDGDVAWRSLPGTLRFQKALNSNVFFAITEDAEVRYKTVDTNDDGTKDALDPNAREGDEVYRGLEILAKKPSGMTDSDLNGDFGRIYIGSYLDANGGIWLETEKNILTFNGNGTFDFGDVLRDVLERNGASVSFTEETKNTPDEGDHKPGEELSAASGLNISVSTDGDIISTDDENSDGFVNDSYDLIVFNESDSENHNNLEDNQVDSSEYNTTIAVKLPDAQLDISNKRYKVLFLGVEMHGSETGITNTRYDSELVLSGTTTGTFTAGSSSEVIKSTPYADVTVENDTSSGEAIAYSLDSTGSMTLTAVEDGDTFTMDGYMSHDGSIGIFRTTWGATDADPSELGVVVLVEVSAN